MTVTRAGKGKGGRRANSSTHRADDVSTEMHYGLFGGDPGSYSVVMVMFTAFPPAILGNRLTG